MTDPDPKIAHMGMENDLHLERDSVSEAPRPAGWMYKSFRFGKWATPWYASPRFQLGLVAFVCFMCPGMFNALTGLGGAGKTDHTLGDNMVCAFPLGNSSLGLRIWPCALAYPGLEHGPLQYLCRRWLLRRYRCQSRRCAPGYVLWWSWLHHLRD